MANRIGGLDVANIRLSVKVYEHSILTAAWPSRLDSRDSITEAGSSAMCVRSAREFRTIPPILGRMYFLFAPPLRFASRFYIQRDLKGVMGWTYPALVSIGCPDGMDFANMSLSLGVYERSLLTAAATASLGGRGAIGDASARSMGKKPSRPMDKRRLPTRKPLPLLLCMRFLFELSFHFDLHFCTHCHLMTVTGGRTRP